MEPFLLGFALSIFSLLLLFINSILFLSKGNKIKNKLYNYITIYLVVLFIVEFFCNWIGFVYPGENFYLSHFYFNAQFLLLSMVFYRLFSNKRLKKVIVINYTTVTIIIISMYIYNNELFWQFNLFEIASTSALLIIYSTL